MKTPSLGDKVSHVLVVESSITEIIEVNNFTHTAKVRDDKGRILLIGQKRRGDSAYQVITELASAD